MATTGTKYATSYQWYSSTWSNPGNIIDNNYTNYSYETSSSGEGQQICLTGFDFSSIALNSIITAYTITIQAARNSSINGNSYLYFDLGVNYVYQNPRTGTYNKLNLNPSYLINNVKLNDSNKTIYTYTSTNNDNDILQNMSQNISAIKNNTFCLDLYGKNIRVYYVTIELEYIIPKIISTNCSPLDGGTVSGGGAYESGTNITLTATPSSGYKFVQWQDGNTTNPRAITVTQDATYTATFEPDSYTISTAISPNGAGTVTGGGTYNAGSSVTLTATPAIGYKFSKWSDNNTNNPRTITASSNNIYTAIFESSSQIYVGATKIQNLYLGTTPIKKIFIGTKQIY